MTNETCIALEGVEPIFVPHMIRGAMACRYARQVHDMAYEDAVKAAEATWGTEWESDPAPRTFEAAIEAVDSDLEYWRDD
jgi:hypothetical protein